MNQIKQILLLVLIIGALCWGCRKDEQKGDGGFNSCITQTSFKKVSYTNLEAVNHKDSSLLTEAERILGIPKRSEANYNLCLHDDGTFSGDVTYILPDEDPDQYYIGKSHKNRKLTAAKLVLDHDYAISYNEDDEPLVSNNPVGTDPYSIALKLSIIEDAPLLPRELIDSMLLAFQQAGFDFQSVDDQYAVLTDTVSDGGVITKFYDKDLQMFTGSIVSGPDGDPISRMIFHFVANEDNQPILERSIESQYLRSPESNILLSQTTYSVISNYSITQK